jgi:hypothetical protein
MVGYDRSRPATTSYQTDHLAETVTSRFGFSRGSHQTVTETAVWLHRFRSQTGLCDQTSTSLTMNTPRGNRNLKSEPHLPRYVCPAEPGKKIMYAEIFSLSQCQ